MMRKEFKTTKEIIQEQYFLVQNQFWAVIYGFLLIIFSPIIFIFNSLISLFRLIIQKLEEQKNYRKVWKDTKTAIKNAKKEETSNNGQN